MSQAEDTLAFQLVAVGISFEREYRFHLERKWRADFLIAGRLIVEVEGAIRQAQGRHQTVDGIDRDCEKYAEAMMLGYQVLRVSARMARDGRALGYIEQLLGVTGETQPVALACTAEE